MFSLMLHSSCGSPRQAGVCRVLLQESSRSLMQDKLRLRVLGREAVLSIGRDCTIFNNSNTAGALRKENGPSQVTFLALDKRFWMDSVKMSMMCKTGSRALFWMTKLCSENVHVGSLKFDWNFVTEAPIPQMIKRCLWAMQQSRGRKLKGRWLRWLIRAGPLVPTLIS